MKSLHGMEASLSKRPAVTSTSTKVIYPDQHQKLQEMGFDAKSIQDALTSTSGDLQAATAVLLGESTAAASANAHAKSVAPMKVVGKQVSVAPKPAKVDYKEIHNKFMATYKVTKCKDKTNHDKRMCFFYHAKGDRRRNPFEVLYSCSECPNSSDTLTCENGDACLKAHNMLERMFHPDLFKISMCQRGPNGSHCERGNLCAFAHSEEDHRVPASLNTGKPTISASSGVTTASASNATNSPPNNGAETITISKSLTDSRMLDSIQEKLVKLIQNQGSEGIISSELPKRFYDAYSERLDLSDEAGEKFRIKDLLLSHPSISMTMHKGVQPKYVYEASKTVPSSNTTAAKKAPGTPGLTPMSTGISYSAMAVKNGAGKAPGPLNYAAAATASAPVSARSSASSASELSSNSISSTAVLVDGEAQGVRAPASLTNNMNDVNGKGMHDIQEGSYAQWSGASLLDSTNSTSATPVVPGSPFLPVGTRRRGPDGGSADRSETATPPTPSSQQPMYNGQMQQQHSPGQGISSRQSLSELSMAQGSSAASSPGKNASIADYHDRLVQATSSCEKLAQQVQALQGELSKRTMESELQNMQMQGMISQLSESVDNQNKANSAKEAALTEVYRVRHELEEIRSQGGDAGQKSRELASKDSTITQLRQEKTADLNQFCGCLTQIESALVEMQRKEARFINEIPLHDTINESSRARDELTKYVTLLKQQMNNKVLNDTAAANAGAGFLKPTANASATGSSASGISSILNMQKLPDSDMFGSPLRAPFSQGTSFLSSTGFLGKQHESGLQLSSSLLGDDLGLMIPDSGDAYSLLLGGSSVPNTGAGASRVAGIMGLPPTPPTGAASTMICALPGCKAEGTFVCSACNRSGYCGAVHQREHWAVHMKECSGL